MNTAISDEEYALINLVRKMKEDRQVGNVQLNFYQGEMAVVQIMTSFKKQSFLENFLEKFALTK